LGLKKEGKDGGRRLSVYVRSTGFWSAQNPDYMPHELDPYQQGKTMGKKKKK